MSNEPKLLSNEQVLVLNERHGWFQFGDAQSDVSRAFANDAVAAYLRLRDAAPDLLEAAKHCEWLLTSYELNRVDAEELADNALSSIRAAIAKATGAA